MTVIQGLIPDEVFGSLDGIELLLTCLSRIWYLIQPKKCGKLLDTPTTFLITGLIKRIV